MVAIAATRGALIAALVLVVAAEHGRRSAASPTCDKSDALDDYLQRVRDGTTGFEQEQQEAAIPPPTSSQAPAPPAAGGSVNTSAVNFQGCAQKGAEQFDFCDMTLPVVERVEDLLSRMTLDQKLGMISPNPTLGSTCNGFTWNGTSMGSSEPLSEDEKFLEQVITYIWLNEANTNVQSACWKGFDGKANKCSTNIGGPNSIASTWNKTVFHGKGVIISTEQRSLRMVGGTNHVGKAPMSVMGFGPNINIQRDPRFGRNTETPGEDPFLVGTYTAEMVKGATEEDQGVPRMMMYMKHFDAYGVNQTKPSEFARYNISDYDFWDSFLPAYRMGMNAGAHGVMCAHIAPNGQNAYVTSPLPLSPNRRGIIRPLE